MVESVVEPGCVECASRPKFAGIYSTVDGMKLESMESDGSCSMEEMEFNWEEYLDETGAIAAPPTAFEHVENGLQSGFTPGMALEVLSGHEPGVYWVATVVTTCGELLLLRYAGYGQDRHADFWCHVLTSELHPVGWSAQHGLPLRPPRALQERHGDWGNFLVQTLTGARAAPARLLEGPQRGKELMHWVVPGCWLELQDAHVGLHAWPVRVEENIGGRLRLRYCGLGPAEARHDQWLFFLMPRIRPLGWGCVARCSLEPPSSVRSLKLEQHWRQALGQVYEDQPSLLPSEVFKDQPEIRSNSFGVGMKLEAVHPAFPFGISPATVTKVFNDKFFLVEMDDLRQEKTSWNFVCHVDSPGILPVHWCLHNGVHVSPPQGYSSHDFDWAEYLKNCGTEAAADYCFRQTPVNHDFQEGMKLEAVNPLSPSDICVATITHIRKQLLWLHLEGAKSPGPDCIVPVDSMDIFPVGWCDSNGFPLKKPQKSILTSQKKIAVVQPEKQLSVPLSAHDGSKSMDLTLLSSETGLGAARYTCPTIYFNHRCFSGPYLNKGRIAELPQSVGPGNCLLVLHEVLSLLINAAYKPSRVLRELQLKGQPQWGGREETIKAKYQGKSYRATVELVRNAEQVTEFCRRTCERLECCPNLFGPAMVTTECPENCSILTKTKYTHYYGKKRNRRVGRPPGSSSSSRDAARKRKKRRSCFVQKKKRVGGTTADTPSESPQNSVAGDDEDEDYDDEEEESISEGYSPSSADGCPSTPEVPTPPIPDKKRLRVPPLRLRASPPALPRPLALNRAKRKRKVRAFSSDEEEQEVQKQMEHKVEEKALVPKEAPTKKAEKADTLKLDSDPLQWSVADVVRFIRSTDCAPLSNIFHEQACLL
uniref:SLED domain-containing protein n=1 Tax=Eptatretus burgeri TaxID=7764 RepID=A0A8C4QAU1_EPTBU